jgi:hypothetical protein
MLNPFWLPKGFDPKEDYKTESDSTLECGTIPKGTKIKIDGCPFVLQDDVKVAASQEIVDLAIKNQNDFDNGIGVVGEQSK